ncbi:MAG: DNA mismatch repair endonuclease MutL [Bacteroidota bacterium]
MSEIIRLLPDHIANQIAAGEVIQRPASVVKELVENAIDAGAQRIDIHIKDAGKTLIQVIDDGCGMSEIDARMAFERHATSKLSSAEDLFNLKTKGFRGEALASIAAIAHVMLNTRQEGREWGTSLTIEGSQVSGQQPVTCKTGSSFAVKNLFFNVPARRNFLKSDAVEFGHIEDEFLRIALAHPGLKFSLVHNDQVIYQVDEANMRKRVVDLFGRSYNDRIVPISEQTDIVHIEGFIGKPEFAKKSRGEQYFFVNDRFFRDSYFNHALTQAYDNLLATRTFPSYFVFLTVDPSVIDVNVHPTKTEIKFENDREIYAILKSSVRQSLGKFNISPSLDFEQETSFDLPWDMNNKPAVEPKVQVNPNYNPFTTTSSAGKSSVSNGNSQAMKQAGFGDKEATRVDWETFYKIEDEKPGNQLLSASQEEELAFEEELKQRNTFLFTDKYLISSVKSGLLLIHFRRAKERIIYDEIMQGFLVSPLHGQHLLFPVSAEMGSKTAALWEENALTLKRLGFEWENSGKTLDFTAVPSYLNNEQTISCIEAIQQKLEVRQLDKGEIAHEFILSVAKAASRQKYRWNQDSANSLLEELFLCPEHQYSPSGKLILKTISNDELYKQF